MEEAVAALRREGLEVAGTACHVGERAQLKELVAFALATYGRIDVLVSNAAVNPSSGPILTMDENAIRKIMDINLVSAVLLCQEAVPHMRAGGAIVFVSSYTGASGARGGGCREARRARVRLGAQALARLCRSRPPSPRRFPRSVQPRAAHCHVRRVQDPPAGPHKGSGRGAGARRHPRQLHRAR